jgi:hypothetical protein
MWSVENNLSISNMDFEEFAASADKNGIHRGFEPPESERPKTGDGSP